MVGAAFTEAAFRRGAFAPPTAANLDPEAVAFAVWCAADLAAHLAAFLAAITLPIGRVGPKQPKRDTVPRGHVVRPLVPFSPQKVRKKSAKRP